MPLSGMLADTVRSIRCARDVSRLFQAIGYTPDNEPASEDLRVVARWRGFQVLAVDAPDPAAHARRLASRVGFRARRALIAAVGRGELAFAAPRIGPGGATPAQRVSLESPDSSAIQFLESLRPAAGSNALAHALHVSELLSTEAVGERFFAAFRQMLQRMVAALPPRCPVADRQTAALLPLTRILFLYFVQAKGWLDGRPDYLRRLLDRTLGARKHFHRQALNPLFFGTLNRPPGQRSGVGKLGTIPYLNGGLFEPHPLERRVRGILFPNVLWRDAFDLVFEKFRFSVREAAEADAIAPDMLGRVFERLMDPGDRGDSGTFYTPETLVRQVVHATIETALRGKPRPTSADLDRLRVLDPAAGSGAFLLGALDRLTELHLAADPSQSSQRAQLRRRILANNLFGVDLSPLAVRLAELRLWLAVIADDPTTEIPRVTPLPNLDGVVRQGNSLLDPIALARTLSGTSGSPLAGARAAAAARRHLFDARGPSMGQAVAELRARESKLAIELLSNARTSALHRLKELAAVATSRDLFGRSAISPEQREERKRLARHHRELARAARVLRNGEVPFFAFEVHAPDVVAAGGFDIIVGNPPWVRAERLSPDTRHALRERFTWWRASPSRGYAHLPDLAIAFLQRAVELVAPGGAVGFVLPSKLTSAAYAETARRRLVAETSLAYLHRVPDREAAAFGATTYPLAIVLRKEPPRPDTRVRLGFTSSDTTPQQSLGHHGPWIAVPDRERDAIEQLRAAGKPLGSLVAPSLGVKTGADGLFVGTVRGRPGPVAHLELKNEIISVERELLRPAVRGRDVRAFHLSASRAIIWTHDSGAGPLPLLPPRAAIHFEGHRAELQRRADYRGGPVWTLFRVPRHDGERIVWPDIAKRPAAVALGAVGMSCAVPLNTCYTAVAADRHTALAIAAVFNSVWSEALARTIADEAQNGFRRINARMAAAFPIPAAGPATDRLVTLSALLHDNPGDPAARDLDDAVADAYGLAARVRDSLRSLASAHR